MKCDSCGAPVENGKCTYCGKEFAQPQSSLKTPPAQPNGGSYYRQTPNFGQGGYVPRPPVQQAPPKKKQSFWSKTGTVVFMLIFFPLIGVCLMWGYKKFNLAARIVVSAVIVFVHIGILRAAVRRLPPKRKMPLLPLCQVLFRRRNKKNRRVK